MTRFIQTVKHTGKKGESYIYTKFRLYKSLKTKSSLPLGAGPDFTLQDMKTLYSQSIILSHLLIHIEGYEWKITCG